MKTIPLPTDTEAQREVVKALIESKSPKLYYIYGYQVEAEKGFSINDVSFEDLSSMSDSQLFTGKRFRLIIPQDAPQSCESDTKSTNDLCQECTCGFDAEGWRIKQEGEIIEHGDVHIGTNSQISDNLIGKTVRFFSFITLRTNRHRADCPTLAVNDKQTCHPSFTYFDDETINDKQTCHPSFTHFDFNALPETQPAEKPMYAWDCSCGITNSIEIHPYRCGKCHRERPNPSLKHDQPAEKPKLDLSGEISFFREFLAKHGLGRSNSTWVRVESALSKIQDHINNN